MVRKAITQDISRIAEIIVFGKRVAYRPIFQNDKVSFNEIQVIHLLEEFNSNPEKLDYMRVFDDGIVKEIVVRGEKDTIIAEIFPDDALANTLGITDIPTEISKIVDRVDSTLNTDRQIHSFVIREKHFERTSTGKIKRAQFNFAEDEAK